MINPTDHNSIFERWQNGDDYAFEELFKGLFPLLLKFAVKMLPKEAIAEELVMDVFFKVWQKRNELVITHNIDKYIYQSVKLRVIDHYRKKEIAFQPLDEMAYIPHTTPASDEQLMARELELHYLQVLETLSPKRREVFRLSRLSGMSYREIATHTGLSINTIENHISASLRTLRSHLKNADFLTLLFFSIIFFK